MDPNRVSVALLRPLAELLGRLDEPPEGFLAMLGVEPAAAPTTLISGAEVDRALEAIAGRRRDPSFGLTLAQTSLVRPLGLFGHLVWMSGTVRDAIDRAVKFYAVVTKRTTLTLDDRAATLRQVGAPGVTRGAILTEYVFASFAMRARAATGERFALRAVTFEHAGAATRAYADVFRVPVTFGGGADELAFDPAHLDLALATADPITSAALEVRALELTSEGHSPLVDGVRRAVAGKLDSAIAMATIARELGTSARTLRRRLEEEGQSLRVIVDAVRREHADAMLAQGIAMKDIAFRLGFSEPSALSRAYKRWKAGTRVK